MGSLSKRFSYRPKHDSGELIPSRTVGGRPGSEQLTIVPVPPDELPEEMRSVLESFISSQRPSLVDTRLARPDIQQHSATGRSQSQGSSTQGYERYEYDGRNDPGTRGPNPKWPFTFSLKGKKIPSRVYHTHKVVPRSRPNAKEQLGKRKWHPSRRHGRVIRQEDYDACEAHELGQTTQVLNSERLLDLSVRSGGAVKEREVGGSRLWRWPRSGKDKLRKILCRG